MDKAEIEDIIISFLSNEISRLAHENYTTGFKIKLLSSISKADKLKLIKTELVEVQSKLSNSDISIKGYIQDHLKVLVSLTSNPNNKSFAEHRGTELIESLRHNISDFIFNNYPEVVDLIANTKRNQKSFLTVRFGKFLQEQKFNISVYEAFINSFALLNYYESLRIDLDILSVDHGLTHRESVLRNEYLIKLGLGERLTAKEMRKIPKRYQAYLSLNKMNKNYKEPTAKELEHVLKSFFGFEKAALLVEVDLNK